MSFNNSSLIPTWYPTIQFSSDITYLELVQGQVRGSSPLQTPAIKSGVISKLPVLLPGSLQIQGVPQMLSSTRFRNSIELLTDLRKAPYLRLHSYYKDNTTLEQLNERE